MLFNWIKFTPVTYGDYVFPKWAEGLGWGLACMSLICLPIGMTKGVIETVGDTFFKVRSTKYQRASVQDIWFISTVLVSWKEPIEYYSLKLDLFY